MRQLKIVQKITNRETPGLDKYLQDISHVDMVTPNEEVELAKKIQNGDNEALEKLTKANLRFVVSVAKQYQNRGLSLQDLINEGNLGLLKAAKRFDHSKGFKFISYAVWWIRQAIHQSLSENSRLVRLPVNKINAIFKINKAISRMEQQYGREPTFEEIAEITKIKKDDIQLTMRHSGNTVSMDASLGGSDDDGNMYDVMEDHDSVSPESELLKESLKIEIQRTLTTIPTREADVLKFYFGLNGEPAALLIEEIARKFEISPERVRQIKDKAIKRLRHNSRSKILKTYLG